MGHTLKGFHSALCVTALFAIVAPAAQAAELDEKFAFDIPSQSLESALLTLSKQAQFQLIVSDALPTHLTQRISGRMPIKRALEMLIKDTKLGYKVVGERTLALLPEKLQSTSMREEAFDAEQSGFDKSGTENKKWTQLLMAQTDGAASTKNERVAPASSEEFGRLEEIVVTAQRYEQKLQDVPIAISVFTGKELDTSSEPSVNDTLFAVPGLNITNFFAGGTSTISIRGVNSQTGIGSNTVSYYVDGVPFGFVVNDFSPDPGTFDLERVEVLRGPQGTLYGANALNGVVRVLTKDADLDDYEFKGRTLVSSIEGGGENFGADGVANVPIVSGKLAARLMVSYHRQGGYIDNLVADNINDGKITNVRLKVNAQPTEDLSIQLGYWGSRSDLGSLPISFPDSDFYPGDEACLLCVPATEGNSPEKIDQFDVYSATMTYDFGWFTASNTLSYLDYANQFTIDWSGFRTTNHAFFPFGIDGPFHRSQTSEVLTNELSLNSNSDGPWVWSAGAIYRDAQDLTADRSAVFGSGVPSQDESTSYAVFGELTRSFADGALELTGGLRYFHDQVHQSQPGGTYSLTSTFNHVSPRVVLTWHPSDNMTIYGSYAQGFRSGINQPASTEAVIPGLPPASEDTLDNYEIGSKGELFDGFLNYEVAAYYIHWTDVKTQLCTQLPTSCQFLYTNAGTANGPGVDVGLTFHPIEQLSVGLTGSWNDLHVIEDVFFGSSILYNDGDRLAGSPEYTLGASLSYRAPLADTRLEWGFSGSVNHKAAIDNITFAGVRTTGDSITDSRLGLELANPELWTFEVFVDNVLNERGVALRSDPTNAFETQFYSSRFRPRTIGAQLSVHF